MPGGLQRQGDPGAARHADPQHQRRGSPAPDDADAGLSLAEQRQERWQGGGGEGLW